MSVLQENIYPNCPVIERMVTIGGWNRNELLEQLHQNAIHLNTYAETLLADNRFIISSTPHRVLTVELAVSNLGFSRWSNNRAHFRYGSAAWLKVMSAWAGTLSENAVYRSAGRCGKRSKTESSAFWLSHCSIGGD